MNGTSVSADSRVPGEWSEAKRDPGPSAISAKRNVDFNGEGFVAWPLGPGSRARIDAVHKTGAGARAWPGHESGACPWAAEMLVSIHFFFLARAFFFGGGLYTMPSSFMPSGSVK